VPTQTLHLVILLKTGDNKQYRNNYHQKQKNQLQSVHMQISHARNKLLRLSLLCQI